MRLTTLIIGKSHVGKTIAELLQSHFHLPPKRLAQFQRQEAIRLDGQSCQLNWRARLGQKLEVLPTNAQPEVAEWIHGINVRFVDEHLLVVEKPAGLTTVRHASEMAELGSKAKKFLPPTLVDLLPRILKSSQRVRAVHRLDKETSGLLVLARTPSAESGLGKQFRVHAVERTYWGLVRGQARDQTIESMLVRDRGDGRRGTGQSADGQRAVTSARVLEQLAHFARVECRLETGRTHQVRIHLGEAGTPLCGETIYDRPLHGPPFPDGSGAARPMLHAATLAFDHPGTGRRVSFESAMPADMKALWKKLARG